MPNWNGWKHLSDTCQVPQVYPSNFNGIYSAYEIFNGVLPYFICAFIVRAIFTKVLGQKIGKPIAKRITNFDINFSKKPALCLLPKNNHKVVALDLLYKDIQSEINKELSINARANNKTMIYLDNKDKQEVLNDIKINEKDLELYFDYKDGLRNVKNISDKFNDQLCKVIMIFMLVCYGINLATDNDVTFFNDPHSVYFNWPQIINENIEIYYKMQFGYHLMRLIWYNHTGNDKIAMIIHHLVTVLLIYGSMYFGLMNIGVLVFIIHDICDVFLPLAKLTKWINYKISNQIFFILFVITWPITRIFGFSYFVIYPLMTTCWDYYGCVLYARIFIRIFTVLLCVLLSLHIYWFYYILKAVQKVIKTGKIDDTRNQDH